MVCGEIFSNSIYYKCSPGSDREISLKIGQYVMKLRHMKFKRIIKFASFWATLY